MPRVYSAGKVEASRIADGDVLNANYKLALESLNGQIDAHQIPMQGFDEASLSTNIFASDANRTSTIGSFNSYYTITNYTYNHVYSGATLDGGWQSVQVSLSPFVLNVITITEPTCVIVGAAQVSGKRIGNTDATTSARFGEDSTWELGVFVDGSLIAETGEIPSGIYTPHLPFSTQLSAGVHTIEARWKQNLDRISATDTHAAFETLSSHMWVRCQKR